MKILFTGASSFTGYWFIKLLHEEGHDITAIFTRSSVSDYEFLSRKRVEAVVKWTYPIWNCKFGDKKFIEIIGQSKFDVVCLHGAYLKDYRSPEFDLLKAIQDNCYNINSVFKCFSESEIQIVIATGSVFEPNEGIGENKIAFSPYGLSKGLSNEIYQYYAGKYLIKYGKFVIPNPFGPFENPRFTTYLIKTWFSGKVPTVNTPKYIRDNIHVALLAEIYCRFLENVNNGSTLYSKVNPSGYVESQGDFAYRFAKEISQRTGISCPVRLMDQTVFEEPVFRTNYHHYIDEIEKWDENNAWDSLADFYIKHYK